ncbi:uncharacterized protein BP01DRAFT_294202 [Aspergillus saccharolyticus JOP 1030-1]|uniref:AHC1-like C2H2 zinc-finger domain-containing protein n=1 Tax=Aspergillus saccharolyticus JOP 1030-1 TaxID=1450539 RepID=A0A318ZQC4_9EURO|nr:hypothetical protein BP01DRAFT_294202 [Aspergillus saccharolyticus JOP 1030-1]PYH46150.1 hypothetical protein BP01DRAFT_294202 [Aspergillus saccharolyticus JOP 1030-1]
MLATSSCSAPDVGAIPLPQLKRKRSGSSDPTPDQDAPVATKLRAENVPCYPVVTKQDTPSTANNTDTLSLDAPDSLPANSTPETSHLSPFPPSTSASEPPAVTKNVGSRKVDLDTLRETLEAQLSLEVLLKHNELRLIDQEIAKCQVALEQLRRCAEIPYPGSNVAGYSQAVSDGTGMAIWAPENGPAPLSPAPWGVTDGPYSRHYSKWLIPDPRFDGGEPEPATPMAGGLASPWTEGRSTRGSCGDLGYMAGKTRPQRGTGGRLQSLPNGNQQPKEKSGPITIRRKSDGLLVKLVCLDCRRNNFSSTQGFINHCRIAHSRNYASHEAAAVESGEPVELDEAGAIIGGKIEVSNPVTAGFIHPLIRSAHVIEPLPKTPTPVSDATMTPRKRSSPIRQTPSAAETPRASSAEPKTTVATAGNTTFMSSPVTPHLSNLMKLRGVAVDLEQLVGEAKAAVDLDDYTDDDGGESDGGFVQPSTEMSQDQTSLGARAGRQPMRTTASQATSGRPGSRKGLDSLDHRPPPLQTSTPIRATPYRSPYPSMSCLPQDSQRGALRTLEGTEQGANLSPNTAESNQAPSLVSDDDDYGEGSDSDAGPSSSEAGDHDEDLGHIDVEDGDENSARSAAATPPKSDIGMASTGTPRAPPLSKSLRRGSIKKKDRLMATSVVASSRGKEEKRGHAMSNLKPYDPDHITKETFQSLLAKYPSTVTSTIRRKAIASSGSSSSSSKPSRKSGAKGTTTTTTTTTTAASASSKKGNPADCNAEAEVRVQDYLALDEFRYTTLPHAVRQRATGEDGVGYLEKEELVRLVEWKMKHGKFRPALLGMVRSNPETTICEATSTASELLQKHNMTEFPGDALDRVTGPLRGVGPATGSLVLSVLADVPFYSDDVFLWLCLGVYPGYGPEPARKAFKPGKSGELDVKYNAMEYRELWDAVRRLRERLGRVACEEVEKVAFVIRFGGEDEVVGKLKDEGKGNADQVVQGKRKRQGKEEEEEEEEGNEEVGVRRSSRRRGGN